MEKKQFKQEKGFAVFWNHKAFLFIGIAFKTISGIDYQPSFCLTTPKVRSISDCGTGNLSKRC
jgi:uncharacterized integral membrane protein